jgi:hypothetical protein
MPVHHGRSCRGVAVRPRYYVFVGIVSITYSGFGLLLALTFREQIMAATAGTDPMKSFQLVFGLAAVVEFLLFYHYYLYWI